LFAQADEKRDHVEVCPEGGVILEHLAVRLEEDGGLALFADYGHDGTKTDTFRVRLTALSKSLNCFYNSVPRQGRQIDLNLDLSSRVIISFNLVLQNFEHCGGE
jgi:SAM-dependent MidA family methyltransferase